MAFITGAGSGTLARSDGSRVQALGLAAASKVAVSVVDCLRRPVIAKGMVTIAASRHARPITIQHEHGEVVVPEDQAHIACGEQIVPSIITVRKPIARPRRAVETTPRNMMKKVRARSGRDVPQVGSCPVMSSTSQAAPAGGTVAGAMLRAPKTCGPGTTVAQVREVFGNDHVHAVLVVAGGELLTVVERPDIRSAHPHAPARLYGRLHDRVTTPGADIDDTRRAMALSCRRRLAVVDDHRTLLGLLCLKRSGLGFCSDTDVRARTDERRGVATMERMNCSR
jgi:CBS domain-containing protein